MCQKKIIQPFLISHEKQTQIAKKEPTQTQQVAKKNDFDKALEALINKNWNLGERLFAKFINENPKDKKAGEAQYWLAETFRIRQLYQDAASAYLDGYQNYPKSKKAPINLLKLGSTLVQLGEKEQGCLMILGVKKQYPKANKSVLQKAEYEKKKFKCSKA